MKRYWKIILLCCLSIIVIGTFYIQSGLAQQEKIEIEFEKIKGNDNEIKDMVLYGDYVIGNIHHSLQISHDETIDPNEQSFFQRLDVNASPIFKELMAQHKSFMRGKELNYNSFFEDDQRLVYAGFKGDIYEYPMNEITFDIDVLDKKSGKTTSIQLAVPENKNYTYMNVEDVQAINGELKVIVRWFGTFGGEDLRVYTFNINGQKLVSDDTIVSPQAGENSRTEIRIINDHNYIQSQKYLLFKMETFEAQKVQSEGQAITYEGEMILAATEVWVYDIENNQLKKWAVPDEMLGLINTAAIFNSTIYLHSLSANGLEISQYDVEKEEWGEKLTFELPIAENTEGTPYVKLMNGKIYMIRSTNEGYTLFVGDLKTGQSLYEGNLNVNKQKDNNRDYQIYFHDIESL